MKEKEFINYLKRNNYSKNTIITYTNILKKYKQYYGNIASLKKELRLHYHSPNTVWTHYNVLCSYMKWSKDKRIDTFKNIKLPKIPKVYMEVFTKKYLMKKTEVKEEENGSLTEKKLLIRFLFETGIRASELYQIIEINKKTIRILGKGNKIREVFHNWETTKQLRPFDYTTKTLRLWVKEVLGDQFTPHSIRRSSATHLLLNGANPKMVMLQLGHEKIETTFRYLNLSLEDNWKIYNKAM